MKFYAFRHGFSFSLLSLLVSAAVCLGGCQAQRGESSAAGAKAEPATEKKSQQIEARITEDEARLKGSEALLAGTIENVTQSELTNLDLEIELKHRNEESTETRTVKVEPARLAPGEVGRYALTVSREWGSARVLRLRGGPRGDELAFTSRRGALRPPERTPDRRPEVMTVQRPRPKGEEFINTPETAEPIR